MKSLLFVLSIFVLLLGCATPPNEAPKLSETQLGKPDQERAVLIIYRKMVPPLAYSVTAKVDGNPLAKLPNKAFTWTYLTPGEHKVEIRWPLLALLSGEEYDLNIEAGNYYFLQFGGELNFTGVGYGTYTTSHMALEEQTKALLEIEECCRLIPGNF